MRRYETIFISTADLSSDERDGVIEKYKKIIEDLDGRIVKVENWGKRRLAYQIKKRREGVYILIDFGGEHAVIQELERNFKIDERILRYQSVKLSDKVDPEELEREIEEARKKETPAEAPPAEEKSEETTDEVPPTEEKPEETPAKVPPAEEKPEEPVSKEIAVEPEEPVSEETTEPETVPEESTDEPENESSQEEKTGE
ncbi:MAG: 30S ribosomal protein S6 [Syntrophaceae bacterium]|nr:30S ribosomal protein S6 [Syntrophaceae bacterium]